MINGNGQRIADWVVSRVEMAGPGTVRVIGRNDCTTDELFRHFRWTFEAPQWLSDFERYDFTQATFADEEAETFVADSFAKASLATIESESIRKWAWSDHNAPLVRKMALAAVKKNPCADASMFGAYLTCVAMGA